MNKEYTGLQEQIKALTLKNEKLESENEECLWVIERLNTELSDNNIAELSEENEIQRFIIRVLQVALWWAIITLLIATLELWNK